jgi:hypothetical protein
MKKSQYTEEKVIAAVKHMEAGRKAKELARELGVTEATPRYGYRRLHALLAKRGCPPHDYRRAGSPQ